MIVDTLDTNTKRLSNDYGYASQESLTQSEEFPVRRYSLTDEESNCLTSDDEDNVDYENSENKDNENELCDDLEKLSFIERKPMRNNENYRNEIRDTISPISSGQRTRYQSGNGGGIVTISFANRQRNTSSAPPQNNENNQLNIPTSSNINVIDIPTDNVDNNVLDSYVRDINTNLQELPQLNENYLDILNVAFETLIDEYEYDNRPGRTVNSPESYNITASPLPPNYVSAEASTSTYNVASTSQIYNLTVEPSSPVYVPSCTTISSPSSNYLTTSSVSTYREKRNSFSSNSTPSYGSNYSPISTYSLDEVSVPSPPQQQISSSPEHIPNLLQINIALIPATVNEISSFRAKQKLDDFFNNDPQLKNKKKLMRRDAVMRNAMNLIGTIKKLLPNPAENNFRLLRFYMCVESLLQRDRETYAFDHACSTLIEALEHIITNGKVLLAEYLVEVLLDRNVPGHENTMDLSIILPKIVSHHKDFSNVLEKLLNSNIIDVNKMNKEGFTALHVAIQKASNEQSTVAVKYLKLLLKTDVDILITTQDNGYSYLHYAVVQNCKTNIFDLLLNKAENNVQELVNMKDTSGNTAHDLAYMLEKMHLIEYFNERNIVMF